MSRLLRNPFILRLAQGLVCALLAPIVWAQSPSAVKTPSTDNSACGGAAMNSEGLKYFKGQAVPKDDWRALRLFQKAADDCDNADAYANLGYMYQTGAAVPRDPYRAKQFYEKAVALDSVEGLTRLGQWYTESFPLPDQTRARMLLEKAATQGSRAAEFALGNMYLFGQLGVSRDPSRALALYEKVADTPAAEWDDPELTHDAAFNIAGIYRVFNNPQQTQIWADRTAELEAKRKPPVPGPTSDLCKPEQLDSTFHIYTEHHQSFTVTVETRNISARACRLDYVAARFQGAPPESNMPLTRIHVDVCQGCDMEGRAAPPRSITFSPDQMVHANISWKSVADSNGSPCVAMGSMALGFSTVAGAFTFYPGSPGIPICSTVDVGLLTPGVDPRADKDMSRVAALRISAPKTTYFPREHMLLNVSATGVGVLPNSGAPCPFLIQRIRHPSGEVRYVPVAGDARCQVIAANPHGSKSTTLQVTLLANVYRELGGYELQLLRYAPPGSKNPWRLLAESDRFHYRINDSYKVDRTSWGPAVKGLAANITLDKTTYSLGEDVPLHLALKNLSVPDRSFHIQMCTDAAITVRDESGRKIEPVDVEEFCSHNGTYNPYFPPTDLLPTEHSLKLMGLLPSKPGTYTIESTWTMYPKPPGANGIYSREKDVGSPYAVVSSAPVTFQVTGSPPN